MGGPATADIQRAGSLRVASDLSYPPMEFRDGAAARGFDIDLAALLAGALGVRLSVVDMPLAAMTSEFPKGADLILSALPAGRTPGIPSDPYYISGQALLWRNGAPVQTLEALRGHRVAAAAGTGAETLIRAAGRQFVTYLPEQAFAAVADGRVQAAVGDRPLVLAFAGTHPDLGATAGPWGEVPLVAAARPDAPDLAAFVSAAIQALRRDGGLDQLRRRWHL
jgi:polar amino acid transport system substrate-binding protein